jgi:hypothetical protein
MLRTLSIALILAIAGCAQLPPSPQDIQAKQFQSLPDKSVIYIVRQRMDSWHPGTLWLDDHAMITTYRHTYYRWEVDPGPHRIAGFAPDGATLSFTPEAGKIYFVQHTVLGPWRSSAIASYLELINEKDGREIVSMGQLL